MTPEKGKENLRKGEGVDKEENRQASSTLLPKGIPKSDEKTNDSFFTPDDFELGDSILFSTYDCQLDHTALKRKYIIHPESSFRKLWINVQLWVALYIIWVTPVRVGFDMPAQGMWFWIEGMIDIFFYTDLVLNFFTAYEHPVTGEIVTDHRKIALRYLKTWFLIDLLATFPTDYVVRCVEGTWACSVKANCNTRVRRDSSVSLIAGLRALRVFRIIWIFKNFNVLSIGTVLGRLQDELYAARWLLSMLELLIVLAFMGHLVGCFFYFFSSPQWYTDAEKYLVSVGEMTTWIDYKFGGYYVVEMPTVLSAANPSSSRTTQYDSLSSTWYTCSDMYYIKSCPKCEQIQYRCRSYFGFTNRYITVLYWAFTTMTTVGYGDISATSISEKVWTSFAMVVGGFFMSFCFGRMASIVSRLDADKVVRSEQLHELTEFMRDVELPRPLAKKVLSFFKKQKVKAYDRQAVLSRLPFELRSKILRHLYLPSLQNVALLRDLAEDQLFLADLAVRLQPTHFSADSYVYQRGETSSDVYILLQGELLVLAADQERVLARVSEDSLFGEEVVLRHIAGQSRAKRVENLLCKSSCDMLKISGDDITDLCEHYPELFRALQKLYRVHRQQISGAPGSGSLAGASSVSLDALNNPSVAGASIHSGTALLQGMRS